VGVSLGVSRLVTGAIRRDDARFFVELSVTDLAASRVESRFFREVAGGLPELVRTVQEAVDQMLDPRRTPGRLLVQSQPEGARVTVDGSYLGTTPLSSAALSPGTHAVRIELDDYFPWRSVVTVAPGQSLHLQLGQPDLRRRRTWAPYLAYGSAAGAVVCLSAGGVFGTLARITPSGATRAEAQEDLGRRRTYGRVGTALLISGAVLSAISAVVFSTRWRDVTGE
jgi:hypothetical protein